jgi:glycosyltransferase involved in cell wall biosynthesis
MLTGIVLAKNEAKNIEACLASLDFCDSLIVVDDNSTDDTVKIAKKMGATVYKHELGGDFAAQHNWILSQIKSTWVLFVDADEVITHPLSKEIKTAITKIEYKGFKIPRIDYLWGKKLTHGDLLNSKVLRLARRGAGEWEGSVHERWNINGKVGVLKNPINHRPHSSMVEFLQHINEYSTLKAKEFYKKGRKTNVLEIVFVPIIKFKILYFWKLGFLDGTAGFVHAMTMAFYTFLVRGKLYLLHKGIPK